MAVSRSRLVSKATAAKAFAASLIAVAGLTVIAVPSAFAAVPTVTAVSPTSGTAAGGTTVTLTGSGYGTAAVPNVTAVDFVSTVNGAPHVTPAASFTVVKGTQLTAVSPKASVPVGSALVDITVTTAGGTSATGAGDHYTYTFGTPTVTGVTTVASPPGGPTAGGTVVNVTGTNFFGVTAVHFGAVAGTSVLENSTGSLNVTAPAGSGTVDITVTNGAGTSAVSAPADQFTYNSTLTLADGTGAYDTGTSTSTGATAQPPIDTFDARSLATGGSGFDPTKFTVVTQPASGNVTFNSTGILTYKPAQTQSSTGSGATTAWTYVVSTTGTQTATIAGCVTGFSYPSPGNCVTATMSFLQNRTGFFMGDQVSALGLLVGVSEDTGNGITAPSTAPIGSNFTVTSAPAQVIIPASQSGINVLSVGQYSIIQPVAAGLTLVPGSLKVMGGDTQASGKYIASYCTAAMGYVPGECTAQMTGNYKTTFPYIETYLNAAAAVPGGGSLTLPSFSAQFTVNASDTNGQVLSTVETEFVASTTVGTAASPTTTVLDAYPSSDTSKLPPPCGPGLGLGCLPPYVAPSPRWSVTAGPPLGPPAVTGVSPTSGPAAGGNAVTITGTNFSGATAVDFGTTAATGVVVNPDGTITATAPAGSGTVDVRVTTPQGQSPIAAPGDQYSYVAAPVVTGVAPSSGPAAGGTSVTITGSNLSGATSVMFGATAGSITLDSASSITATSPAGSGTVHVTVTTPGGTSATSAADQFTYVPAPVVTGIAPTTGPIAGGTSVIITGTGLTGATAVAFGATAATTFTVNSDTQVTATSPAAAVSTVDIRVTTPGGTSAISAADQFSYTNNPSVSSVSPSTGPVAGGTSVIITGANFTGATAVHFGALAATGFSVDSNTQITATSPAEAAGTVNITVTNATATSATSPADQFTYVTGPAVSSLNPSMGPIGGGTTVTITGTGFTGATAVSFGSTAASSFTVNSATQITATSPPEAAGTVDVRVTGTGGTSPTSPSDQFTFVVPPTVSAVAPSSGPAAGGTSVTLTGTGFLGATAVDFGANTAIFTVNTATQIVATSPAGSGVVAVTVTTPGGTSVHVAGDQFSYVPAPTVSAVHPASGPTAGGTSVTVTGTNLSGATSVMFGATAASTFHVASPTQITATSPAGSAGTVDLTVVSAGGTSATSAADHFTFVAAPTVTAVSPTSGPVAGGTTVTVTGTGLLGASAVHFGSSSAASFTVDSATSITATAPTGSVGIVDVTVTTAGGTSAASSADHFSYFATAPGAPTNVQAFAGNASATVSWTPPFNGGSAITGYLITVIAGSSGHATAHTPIAVGPGSSGHVTGLTNGTTYTFTVSAVNAVGTGAASAPSNSVTPANQGHVNGYWLATADGNVFAKGAAVPYGSPGNVVLNAPIVGIAATPDGKGYWLAGSDGGVFAYGDAHFLGSMGGSPLNAPIVGIASTPDGQGYWLVGSDGGVFAFGDAAFHGSTGGMHLNASIVGMAGNGAGGYWLVGADGGLFSYDAAFYGSMGGSHLNRPVVAMAPVAGGTGYWMVGADGGVFSFGSAPFEGSAANTGSLVTGMTPGSAGGYYLAAPNGTVFAYGAPSFGSVGPLESTVVSITS